VALPRARRPRVGVSWSELQGGRTRAPGPPAPLRRSGVSAGPPVRRSACPPMTHARSRTTRSAPPLRSLRRSAGPPMTRALQDHPLRSAASESPPVRRSAGPPVRLPVPVLPFPRSPTTTSPSTPRTPRRSR
jgi:hypothetical protein